VETFINNDEIDASVAVPLAGAALTDVPLQALRSGRPAVTVDREFSAPSGSRATARGANYGTGAAPGGRTGEGRECGLEGVAGAASTSASGAATIRMPWCPRSPVSTPCR